MNSNDLFQEKIKQARMVLTEETRSAIDAVPWSDAIIGMRETKKLSFSQIETLGFQTELLLCGLLNPSEYPKELKSKMGLSDEAVDMIVKDMNELVFKKIKEKLVEKIGQNRAPSAIKTLSPEISNEDSFVMKNAGINLEKAPGKPQAVEQKVETTQDMLAKIENPDLIVTPPISAQKLSGFFQIPSVKTDYIKTDAPKIEVEEKVKPSIQKADPYREIPE